MIAKLEFSYRDGLSKDESAETSARTSIDMWLQPFEKEIDEKNISVHVLFLNQSQKLLSLRGADVGLQLRCKERINQFKVNSQSEFKSYYF